MGPKYEFTGETKNFEGRIVRRIRRLSDGKIGGWIEKEENLSQEGNCWVDDNAVVCDDAQVYGNAKIYGDGWVGDYSKLYDNTNVFDYAQVGGATKVYGNATVYGNAKVYGNATVYGEAEVTDNAYVEGHTQIYGNAKLYDDAWVYDDAHVYGSAIVSGDAIVCGNAKVDYEVLTGKIGEDLTNNFTNENIEVLKDFIYKIDDSSKLDIQTNYDSVDAFFEDNSTESYSEHECIKVISIDTNVPLVKLEKTQVNDKNVFRFIVDITSKDGDDYIVRSVIDSKDKFDQLLKSTVDALKSYSQFSKYAGDIENCL